MIKHWGEILVLIVLCKLAHQSLIYNVISIFKMHVEFLTPKLIILKTCLKVNFCVYV